ncbi:MAG TPA: methyltransferase domain-containing protein [Solirubrobacteraceae bacterium]|jgi:SAM-dependent methyltransferase|nr:methyltransferase domain-containing protein [Solirubrobacteraceae bacterium]
MTTDTPTTSGYALDSAWHAERERLDSLTRLYDPGTIEACHRLGVADGWRCLDVGAGTGTLARTLLTLTAPSGSVTALDADTRFLDPFASDRLEVVRSDITTEPPPAGAYDLVHARLLLEHLPERDRVLTAIVGAAKPGGWVLIEDFDWATALVIDPPSETHEKIATAIREVFTSHGYSPTYGRTLPRRLAEAGLTDVGTRAEAIQVQANREAGVPQWELLAQQFAPALLGHGLVTQDELDAFHALWHDGRTVGFSPLMVSCWGRVPAHA